MIFKTPSWAQHLVASNESDPSSMESSPSSSSSSSLIVNRAAVTELVRVLILQRQQREIALAIRTGLRDAKAEFSFMRIRGLKKLARFLAVLASEEGGVELFRASQVYPELQVVPVLFKHTLAPPKDTIDMPTDPTTSEDLPCMFNPPTSAEILSALRVLEVCCLLDNGCKTIAAQHMAVKELLELFSIGGVAERTACLSAILALMVDSQINQKEFYHLHGARKVADLVQNGHVDIALRLKCAEFLLLLIGNVLPSAHTLGNHHEGRNMEVTAEDVQQELVECLKEHFSTFDIEDYHKMEPSLKDFERKQNSLRILAQQLLNSIDGK